jgi:hypothetical protein
MLARKKNNKIRRPIAVVEHRLLFCYYSNIDELIKFESSTPSVQFNRFLVDKAHSMTLLRYSIKVEVFIFFVIIVVIIHKPKCNYDEAH